MHAWSACVACAPSSCTYLHENGGTASLCSHDLRPSAPASGSASGRCFSCFISNWNGGCLGGTGSRARRTTFALVIISCCSGLKTEPLVRGSLFTPMPVRLTRVQAAGIDGESVPQGARYLEFICRITQSTGNHTDGLSRRQSVHPSPTALHYSAGMPIRCLHPIKSA